MNSMYNLTIITKYNTIYLAVDDINDPEVQEILDQPWVVDVKYWQILENDGENSKFKRLIRRKMEWKMEWMEEMTQKNV